MLQLDLHRRIHYHSCAVSFELDHLWSVIEDLQSRDLRGVRLHERKGCQENSIESKYYYRTYSVIH